MDKTPVAPPSPVPTTGTKASVSRGLHPRERLDVAANPAAKGRGEGAKWEVTDTYNDWDGGGSAQDLLHQPVAVVQGFHDLPLILGDL